MSLEKSLSKWVDKIAKSIPGFSGYFRKEERRENDRRMREKISHIIEKIIDVLNEKGRIITKSGDISLLDRIGRIRKRLEKLKDGIRYADYGYSGFFDKKEISEDTLCSVYNIDHELLEWSMNFKSNTDKNTQLDDIANNIEKGFELLEKRSEIIEGV